MPEAEEVIPTPSVATKQLRPRPKPRPKAAPQVQENGEEVEEKSDTDDEYFVVKQSRRKL